MQPKILISGARGSRVNYEQAVSLAGGEPCSGYCPEYDEHFAGLLLAGGDDIDPAHFSQPNRGSRGIDLARDRCELELLDRFLGDGKPVLAVCRGLQVVNVALGGSLIQDLSPDLQAVHTAQGSDKLHPVDTLPGSLMHTLLGAQPTVTSSHHQAVDRLGTGLRPTARTRCGLIEALEHESLPIVCVQFHPERMCGKWAGSDRTDAALLFSHFISLCK